MKIDIKLFSKKRGKIKLKRRYPSIIERNYRDYLNGLIKEMEKESIKILSSRNDGLFDEFMKLLNLFKISGDLGLIVTRLIRHKNNEILKSLDIDENTGLGVDFFAGDDDMLKKIKLWNDDNTKLIKSVHEQYLGGVKKILLDGFKNGTSSQELAKQIYEQSNVSEKRAKVIARNEIGNLTTQVELAQNKELGITEYIWRTSRDERVRGNPSGLYPNAIPSHYDRNGKTYTLSEGAGSQDRHPGLGIQCRCTMEAIVEI